MKKIELLGARSEGTSALAQPQNTRECARPISNIPIMVLLSIGLGCFAISAVQAQSNHDLHHKTKSAASVAKKKTANSTVVQQTEVLGNPDLRVSQDGPSDTPVLYWVPVSQEDEIKKLEDKVNALQSASIQKPIYITPIQEAKAEKERNGQGSVRTLKLTQIKSLKVTPINESPPEAITSPELVWITTPVNTQDETQESTPKTQTPVEQTAVAAPALKDQASEQAKEAALVTPIVATKPSVQKETQVNASQTAPQVAQASKEVVTLKPIEPAKSLTPNETVVDAAATPPLSTTTPVTAATQATEQTEKTVVVPQTKSKQVTKESQLMLAKQLVSVVPLLPGNKDFAKDSIPQPKVIFEITNEDETMSIALRRWATKSGYDLLWDVPKDFVARRTVYTSEEFPGALEEVMRDTALSAYPLHACIYKNKIARVLHSSQSCER